MSRALRNRPLVANAHEQLIISGTHTCDHTHEGNQKRTEQEETYETQDAMALDAGSCYSRWKGGLRREVYSF